MAALEAVDDAGELRPQRLRDVGGAHRPEARSALHQASVPLGRAAHE